MPPTAIDTIKIRGAAEHNLRAVDLNLPRDSLCVITGLSGSGKSSLAFDTIYAEGQRRYVESLSAYARQFLDQMRKPKVELIEGLSPAISIEQKTVSKNPRSTVGTVTEIYDYLRVLYANIGRPHCPKCGRAIAQQTVGQIAEIILSWPEDTKFMVMAPIVRGRKGEYRQEFEDARRQGYVRARVDGKIIELDDPPKLNKKLKHEISLVIDRLTVLPEMRGRLLDSLETALRKADGLVEIQKPDEDKPRLFSEKFSCPECGTSVEEMTPRLFSFNSPYGACAKCKGLGVLMVGEEDSVEDEGEPVEEICPECRGLRLRPAALSVKIGDNNIAECCRRTVGEAVIWFNKLELNSREESIGRQVLKEIRERLVFLQRVGLDYLSLDRRSGTLSGGEGQRIRLATQIGSQLTGVLYVLDEPSIGLHQRDNQRLIDTLKQLRDLGNTLIVVEHDEHTIREADYVVDLGPGAGRLGGHLVAAGPPDDIIRSPESITGSFLRGDSRIELPTTRRKPERGRQLVIRGAREHNLKNLDVPFPLGTFICVTGVSGSGKSTLVTDILFRALCNKLFNSTQPIGAHDKIDGLNLVDKIVDVDQSPIGRTPRSNPVTYTGVFSVIRDLFARLPESQIRGYGPGRFSFNVKGGRCEACQGDGMIKVEMHFLPDVFVECQICHGRRFNTETLEVKYKDKSIADVLEMTVEEATGFFSPVPSIAHKIDTLNSVGLGYITLGQSATTLSGGEAQRVKLSKELSRRGTGRTVYILDEPTTGLHFEDVRKLLQVLQALVDQGNTVIVVEHNLDVIKSADHVIDLGPEGGEKGGRVVAAGTPDEVAANKNSVTGHYLAEVLARGRENPSAGKPRPKALT